MKTSALILLGLSSSFVNCASPVWGQCGGNNWTGDTTCVSGSCCTFQNEWYSQCLPCDSNGGGGATTTSTTGTAATSTTNGGGGGGSGATPTTVTTTLPASSGVSSASTAIPVTASFDGGMKRFERNPAVCQEQTETGEADAMFILEDGATLSNVIIGASQAEGVHCRGTCTLVNVWWSNVCEDAATFKQSSGTSYVIGGGAFNAEDKILQFNGFGTLNVKHFYANDYGKVVRSCGNCSNNGGARHIIMDDIIAVNGGVLCGINTNYFDTCTITNSCQDDGKSCDRYQGNNNGDEPSKIGSGPDGTYCTVSNLSENC